MNNILNIPLDVNIADQQLDITLEGRVFTLRITWNTNAAYWYMGVFNRDGTVILNNIKLVSNTSLLSRYGLECLSGDFMLFSKSNILDRAEFASLGTTHLLLYIPKGEETLKHYLQRETPSLR